jgi:hypothetical protein
MNLLVDTLAEVGPWSQRWLRKMERKLFAVIVAAAIIVLMGRLDADTHESRA